VIKNNYVVQIFHSTFQSLKMDRNKGNILYLTIL